MKKLFLVALAAVGMAACVQTEELGVANNKEAIAFDTFVDNATKASAYDNKNPLDHFNVYGTISKKDENGTKTYVTTIFDGVEVLKSSTGVWAYDPQFTQYWVPGFTYDFAAVVDAKEVVCENGLPATIKTDMKDQNDVLYATAGPRDFGANDTAEKVSFQLAHLLSKAKFTVKNTIENGQGFVYNVQSIKIKNADWNGAYDVATGVWAATNTYEADFGVAASLAMGSQPVSGSDVYLLPSANKDLDIEVVYNLTYNGATLKSETKTIAAVLNLEQGKAYNFIVEFGNPGEEIEFEATVRDWANGSVEVFQGVSVPVTTAQELIEAIADPEVGEAVLMNDIDLTSTITRSGEESTPVIAKSFVIDGNDKILTYSGSNRVIDITYNEGKNDNLVVTIKDLTINCSAKYCQRGINYNAGGLLIIDNVKFEGTAPTYAVNCPASSDNAVVKIKDSEIVGNIALNLWGENMKVDVTDSHLISVDNTEAENYAAISLNNDGSNIAEGTVVNIERGSVIARDEKNEPSYAVRNSTLTGCVNISETTEVVGGRKEDVAMIYYNGYSEFYTTTTLQSAINKAIETNASGVRVLRDLELLQPITIPAGKSVVLDLNGKTLSGVDTGTASYGLITNNGNLTIQGTGKLQLSAENDRDWNAYSSVISNQPGGTLTVNGGTIEHLGGTDMAYAIDNLTNGNLGNVTCTINGGLIKSTYRAIRQFLNSDICMNTLTVNGGTIFSTSGNKSIWMQDPSTKANTGKLEVNEGAQLESNVYLSVTAGSTEWPVEVSIDKDALAEGVTVDHSNVPDKYVVVEENGFWTVAPTPIVVESAVEFIAAVNNIVDGGTVIVGESFDFTKEEGGRTNNGGWWDGLGYSGDKSFTINLNGKTVGNAKDALNDYLFWFKNDGEKPNTITIKNGTLDAGTTAYCALCTANSGSQPLTINLENVTLINNKDDGSTIKARTALTTVNLKNGTKVIGKNSYLGIECWKATVNIYEGAEIYMNGTASYNGCLAGVGGNGVINVYGGYGKGVSGGLIAMTSGGTINVSGGEWIANTDGTYANSNKSVLVAQSDKQYNAGAGNAVVNVTGGTFKGGFNCYGNAVGDAQINISGGNFNANPTSYLYGGATATENNGIWTVTK